MPARCLLPLCFLSVILVACGAQAATPREEAPPTEDEVPPTEVPPPTEQEISPTEEAVAEPTEEPVNATTSGTIASNEVWRDEIHITGDIYINPGITLTIEPGTTVYVASFSDDQRGGAPMYTDEYIQSFEDPTGTDEWVENAIIIDGHIIAEGTPDAPITFTTEGDSDSTAQWVGVEITEGSLRHCLIENAHIGVNIQGPGVEVAHCTVRNNLWVAIDVHDRDAWVHHNVAYGGGHQTVGIFANNGLIENNVLRDGQQCISGEWGYGTVVRNNVFIDNASGIDIGPDAERIDVVNNTIVQVAGPPDGWYFKGDLIYPSGIAGSTGIRVRRENWPGIIANNIIVGYQQGLAFDALPGEEAQIAHNLEWGTSMVDFFVPGVSALNTFVADPLFVDPENEDFTLQPGSPAIDAGLLDLLDADGTISDLGAYGGEMGDW
jgi:hypothetical protein